MFPIIEVADDGRRKAEHVGTKEKFWVDHDATLKLVKFGRDNTGENWAEKAACELAGLVGLPHAQYEFARYRGSPCVLSSSVIPPRGELVLGNQIIGKSGIPTGQTRQYLKKDHTVSRVIAAIIVQTRPNIDLSCGLFCGYLMLDAWIGNTDRHEENWGIIIDGAGTKSLAPTFDHASSMGRELLDAERKARMDTRDERYSVSAFASKARSAIFDEPGDRKPLKPIEAFVEFAKIFQKPALSWLNALSKVDEADVEQVFAQMPPDCISATSAAFAMRMLNYNRTKLLELVGAR